ncbi:MAG: hypothetical protein KUG77_18115, partial [Nannocystaceae bacterium]|nr:hypothetical protein [Nannocystaceae bacterium]
HSTSRRQRQMCIRDSSARDCGTLVDAAVVIIAAAAEREESQPSSSGPAPLVSDVPDTASGERAEDGPPTVDSDTTVQPPAAKHPKRRARQTSEPPPEPTDESAPGLNHLHAPTWLVSVGAGPVYDWTSPGVRGAVGLGRQWPRARLEGRLEASGTRAGSSAGRLDLAVVALNVRGCGVLSPSAQVELLPCGGLSAGPAIGRGRGVRNGRRAVTPWALAHADFITLLRTTERVSLGLELSGQALLARPRFVLSDGQRLYESGRWGVRAAFVVEFRLGQTDSSRR